VSSRLRTVRIAVVIAAVFAAIMVAPGVAAANLVDDVAKGVNDTLDDLLGGGKEEPAAPETVNAEPTPNAGTPPAYVPPAHGSDQHAQGTPATVDLTPSDALPLPYEPGGGSEDVVVGGSRGSVNSGDYHGHVTILALLGNELIQGADTAEGQTSTGPLGDLNALLADICSSSGICLSVLSVNSETTDKSSKNSFSVADANIGPAGTPALDLGAVQSNGEISQAGGCRTGTASSSVADLNALGITVNAIDSSSESRACNDGSESQTNSSSVLGLGGAGLPLPAPGCENGTPDTVLEIPAVLALVCNADDASGTGGVQLQAPYGVREGLAAFVLGSTAKATTAASESHVLAPGKAGDGGDDDRDGDGIPNDRDDCPGQPGPASNDGCPLGGDDDRDNDGVPNDEDECPNTPGPPSNDGCPLDTDGDGVLDTDDACPTVPGPPENDGCPFGLDTDGDGIPDADDACPTVPGPASNDGCPFGGPSGKGPDNLAFSGADVATLGLIGLAVGGSGLALLSFADWRRRRA
jgi:hypothetical protein